MKKNYTIDQIIHQISYHPDERLAIFRQLKANKKHFVILRLTKHVQYDIISNLEKNEIVSLLEHLDPDEATDILQLLPERKRTPILEKMNDELKKAVSLLLKFDPETAAGLMNIDYISVDANDTISTTAQQVKIHEKRTGKLPAILVLQTGRLIGYLPGHELGYANPKEKIRRRIKKIKSVRYNADTSEIIDIFKKYPHNKIAVLANDGGVIGVIYSDDVLKIMHEYESASLYDFAGVHDEESVYDSIGRKIKFRYKWLIINLGTAFLAAFTVGLFENTISKYVLLAVYMPIVAGMGGNAGTQTLAILVRGISLRQINLQTMWHTLKNELGAGFANGLINGLIVAAIIAIKDHDLKIGIILAMAMVINLIIAAFFGTIIPLVMKRLGKDPASSATIFITTATDVLGFLTFLGLATLLLD